MTDSATYGASPNRCLEADPSRCTKVARTLPTMFFSFLFWLITA